MAVGEPAIALREVPLTVLQQLAGDREAVSIRPRPLRSFEVLRRWGLTTVGELAALPAAALSARLGADGIALQRLARGQDVRPLVPDPAVRRFLESCELEWPIDTLEPLSFVFARLLDPLAAALERADRGGIALHSRLRLTDRTTHLRTLALPVPMRDPRVLRTLLLLDLESHPPAAAIDVVTIEIDPAPGRVVQYLAARASGAVAGNPGHAHGPPRRARRRHPLRLAAAPRHSSAGRLAVGAGRVRGFAFAPGLALGGYGAAGRRC